MRRMNPMTAPFHCIVALALVVLAINTEAIQFFAQHADCTNSNDGIEDEQLFLASTCQSLIDRTSLSISCSTGEFKQFNSTDCTGEVVLQIANTTCIRARADLTARVSCEDLNDPEYIRRREFPKVVGSANDIDCDSAFPATTFIRLDKCYEGNSLDNEKSFKFEKVNATAFTKTDYTAAGCNLQDAIETNTKIADGSCDSSGIRFDFMLAKDIGNRADHVRISGYVLGFAFTFAGIFTLM